MNSWRIYSWLKRKIVFWLRVKCVKYSLINMRQLQVLIISAKTWHRIVCWFSWISLFLSVVNLKLFCFYLQNNFLFTPGKFRGIQLNQQTIICQVLAWLKKIWNCLIVNTSLFSTHCDTYTLEWPALWPE